MRQKHSVGRTRPPRGPTEVGLTTRQFYGSKGRGPSHPLLGRVMHIVA